jgi:hypothetical protein
MAMSVWLTPYSQHKKIQSTITPNMEHQYIFHLSTNPPYDQAYNFSNLIHTKHKLGQPPQAPNPPTFFVFLFWQM